MPAFEPIKDLCNGIRFMIYNPRSTLIWGPALLAFESILLKLIVWNIPYTEIDYKAYMEQIDIIRNGEKDYSKVYGGTGPLVYPAGHVLLYRFMYWLTEGTNYIHRGQDFFRYLYLLILALQFVLYYRLQLPGWCVVLACLSKRLHSIYVLRLFNDCFTTFFMVITVLLLQLALSRSRRWLTYVASLTYSFALGIKMNALLYSPGIAVSIFYLQNGNLLRCLTCGTLAIALQYVLAIPFLSHWRSYLNCAFDFHRKFLYHWTINWHFLDEKTFNSDQFHQILLVIHIAMLLMLLFLCLPSWPTEMYRMCRFGLISRGVVGTLPLIFMANFVGIVCARSLHYQFLSWYHWTLPILLFYSGFPALIGIIWYAIHEWCWNSYPPNSLASLILVTLNGTLLISCAIRIYKNGQKKKSMQERQNQQPTAVRTKSNLGLSNTKND